MSTTINIYHPTKSHHAVAQALQKVLANTYGLFLATHNYHWNVEGLQFYPLHNLFEQQYNELFLAIDIIAERIRALGEYALPFEGDNVIQITRNTTHVLEKDNDAEDRADRMLQNLIDLNEGVVRSCQEGKSAAQNVSDDESESLLVERITVHQKVLWMLQSASK